MIELNKVGSPYIANGLKLAERCHNFRLAIF